jgi:2-polyprenyl-3-methyl-5-hydroxy-6-metoxy-1,4-benzoquinol methylase
MEVYAKFAHLYAEGQYPHYSETMVSLLPPVLERFHAAPREILDIACGEGTFCIAMAKKGYRITGVDASAAMLEIARTRAAQEKVEVQFLLQDMRTLDIGERYDLVTCWYDSLNYLLEGEDLERTFACTKRVLKPGGLFIFDMNTIYGLSVNWQRSPCSVQQDTATLFEVHRPGYDFEKNVATLRITGFVKERGGWRRIDEEHRERGYSLEEIEQSLDHVGFQHLVCWGDLMEMSEPKADSGRVWFVVKK